MADVPGDDVVCESCHLVEIAGWTEYVPTVSSHGPDKCNCPIRELIAFGCKCGGFEREKESGSLPVEASLILSTSA